jgi:hypothetical protein
MAITRQDYKVVRNTLPDTRGTATEAFTNLAPALPSGEMGPGLP